jgi:hypothetical protein
MNSRKARKTLKKNKANLHTNKKSTNSNFRRKNVLIFLGAGSTICFGGPRSDEILSELLTDERFKTRDDRTVGQYLFDKLHDSFGEQTNFETIIAAIELIINYQLAKENDSENPNLKSIIPSFLSFDESFLEQIDNFTLYEIDGEPDQIILEYYNNGIPQTITWPRKLARLYYYSKILNNFLSLISIKIASYADGNIEYNLKLKNFFNYLISSNYQINFFTTNYDNLLPNILENRKIFNGFDTKYLEEEGLRYNPKKIIFDDSVIKFFNLHGSIYWHHEFLMDQTEYQFIFKDQEYNLPIFSQTDITNPGEELVLSNIITGYNKTQRTLSPPFSLMLESFLKECVRTDILIIIGYSFSDNHLNKILSIPFSNDAPKIINITHSSDAYLNSPEGQKFSAILKRQHRLTNPLIYRNFISSSDKNQIVFFNGFDDFLNDKENWKTI